ncbi:MAG: GDP-mannose 4,6-dehydratase [Phycisphaerae bacterium]|nr:GDP-mannose 4,6-dehydratase [Phycisphaerae bacterium]NNF42561.1 NAD-dependent epimerase/dehydratase family protein [Phycisphaerales bacterium]
MPQTILVTGAAGFIGSHLTHRLLAGGARVVGVDNFDGFYGRALKEANLAALPPGDFRLEEADIRDAEAVETLFTRHRPTLLVHLAALAGVRPSIAEPRRYAAVNVDGLVNLLESARRVECRHIVFASSSSVYGNAARVPFAENDRADEPISPYAATKRAGELVCHAYRSLYGLSISALRFFTVYGPAQRPDLAINLFMRRIAAGEPIAMFGDGTTARDYTYIDDIVDGVLAAIERTRTETDWFRIYNLGGAHPTPLAEMIDAIARVVGRDAIVERQPMQPGDVNQTYADLTRSHAELGFEPKVAFEDGLRRQWTWMQTAGR